MSTDPFDATAAARDAAMGPTGDLPVEPAEALAVVTCMDARVVPHELFGLAAGDVHVLRNAGGRVSMDVLRSLLVSTRLLGVDQVVVVHHTGCGGARSDRELTIALREAGVEGDLPDLLGAPDPVQALRADLEVLRNDTRLPADLRIAGYRYDLDSGEVVALAELEGVAPS